MGLKFGWIALCFGTLALFRPVAAQTRLRVGERVRLDAGQRYTGTVVRADTAHLLLQPDDQSDTVAIRLDRITDLALFSGRSSAAGRGALIGSLMGGSLAFHF